MASNSYLMNEEALMDWILEMLGGDFVKVELYDESLRSAIESARRWFAAKKGVQQSFTIDVMSDQSVYDLPDGIDTVQDIFFAASQLDIGQGFYSQLWDNASFGYLAPYGFGNYGTGLAPESGGLYSSIVQTVQYIEMAKRILNVEADWRQEGRKLYVWPIPKNASKITLIGKSSSIVIEQLSERDHDLLKRWALADAKYRVGRVRSKYLSGFPTAQGHEQLDGEALLAEAKEEKEALDEEIGQSGMPMMILTG